MVENKGSEKVVKQATPRGQSTIKEKGEKREKKK